MSSRRRENRVLFIQTLFQNEFTVDTPLEATRLKEIYNGIAEEYAPHLKDEAFSFTLIDLFVSKHSEIDGIIEQATTNWKLSNMGILDKAILRLGVLEILFGHAHNTPGKVALNEAIELAKMFLGDKGSKFINGVLGAVYTQVCPDEPEEKEPIKPKIVQSVGALIFKASDEEGVLFALVHDVFNRWTLPKGGVERGESHEHALHRVLETKLKVEVQIVDQIGNNSFVSHPPEGPVRKEITYFLAQTENPLLQLIELEGLMEAKWFAPEDIERLLMYPDTKKMVLGAVERTAADYAKK